MARGERLIARDLARKSSLAADDSTRRSTSLRVGSNDSPTAPTPEPTEIEVAQVVVGEHYDYFPGTVSQEQATVESIDLSAYREEVFTVEADTRGHRVRVGLYRGRVDLNRWWGDSADLTRETEFVSNPSIEVLLSPNLGAYSIVYSTRPVEFGTPELLEITRTLSVKWPKYPTDWSRRFVTEFWTFPDEILNALVDPPQFNEDMNRQYSALRDLVGRESDCLDVDGHIRLVVEDISPYCGLAGNPIRMDPVCMPVDVLNSGNPGWGPAHELGHDFAGSASYHFGEAAVEGWANFMAFYAYDNGIFINSDYDREYWANVWETSPKPTDIFQGLIVRLSHQHTWEVARVFFRKYLAADPARDGDNTARRRQAVRYLAESVEEVTGRRADYDYVVEYLALRGFPRP